MKKSATNTPPPREVLDTELWEQLPAAEWLRRLRRARTVALQTLAGAGLSIEQDSHEISSLIVYKKDAIGLALAPTLGPNRGELDELVKAANVEDLDETITAFTVSVIEAAYRFGIIVGCHVPWPVIEATEASSGPPIKRTATTGGAK